MDRVRQVQVTCDSYCGANLRYGLPIKDNSLGLFLGGFFLVGGFGFFFLHFFCCVSSSAFCSDDADNSEEGKLWR